MAKTQDGIKLTNILAAVKDIPGIVVKTGTNHPYLLKYESMQPCPLAKSTHAKRMLVPWLYQVINQNKQAIYLGLKKGKIYT